MEGNLREKSIGGWSASVSFRFFASWQKQNDSQAFLARPIPWPLSSSHISPNRIRRPTLWSRWISIVFSEFLFVRCFLQRRRGRSHLYQLSRNSPFPRWCTRMSHFRWTRGGCSRSARDDGRNSEQLGGVEDQGNDFGWRCLWYGQTDQEGEGDGYESRCASRFIQCVDIIWAETYRSTKCTVSALQRVCGPTKSDAELARYFSSPLSLCLPIRLSIPSYRHWLLTSPRSSPCHLLYASSSLLSSSPSSLPEKFLLIHGGADQLVPYSQSVLLKNLLVGVGKQGVRLRLYREETGLGSLASTFTSFLISCCRKSAWADLSGLEYRFDASNEILSVDSRRNRKNHLIGFAGGCSSWRWRPLSKLLFEIRYEE